MSRYEALWEYISYRNEDRIKLTFGGIADMGAPLDHSFLKAKKELERYGWKIKKISLKEQTVLFERIQNECNT